MLYDLVLKNRSYRRFDQSFEIKEETLRDMCNHARFVASAGNCQYFKFRLTPSGEECEKVFSTLGWAGHIKNGAPPENEHPSAYITIVNDNSLGKGYAPDIGIIAQTILLRATELGLGGCMLASAKRPDINEILSLPEDYEVVLIIALGKPIETVVLDDVKDGKTCYWRDENRVHHVPKRPLEELIIK